MNWVMDQGRIVEQGSHKDFWTVRENTTNFT